MRLLGIDLETTGLDIETLDVLEIGAILWDTERQAPLAVMNHLINEPGVEVPELITILTGIRQEDLRLGLSQEEAYSDLVAWADEADYLVAHNGTNFDVPIIKRDLAELNMIMEKNWIDTSIDIDFPTTTRKLTHLAAEHNFINPFAHRAFSDVLTMLKVLSNYDIDEVVENSKQPLVEVQACTLEPWKDPAPDGKKETDLAKARGYRWNPQRKMWVKNIRKSGLALEQQHGEFGIIVLGETKRG